MSRWIVICMIRSLRFLSHVPMSFPMDIMWPISQSHFHILCIFIEIKFYSLSKGMAKDRLKVGQPDWTRTVGPSKWAYNGLGPSLV